MTDILNHPWINVNPASSKRVDVDTKHKFYWIKDDRGRPGLRINFSRIPSDITSLVKVNGIATVVRTDGNADEELYFVLTNACDQDIFCTLCLDLINSSLYAESENKLFSIIVTRIQNWQRFLSTGASKKMSEQLQMGLFAELCYLHDNVFNSLNGEDAIETWVGPDFDKQDFSFHDSLAEVKSFITSKGPFVKISSVHQLFSDTKPLYLIAFGLSKSYIGLSIENLISHIRIRLSDSSRALLIFENKLNQYNYFEGITEGPFFQYIVDSTKTYEISSGFPKIVPASIAGEITAVQYTIDLSRCTLFESTAPY